MARTTAENVALIVEVDADISLTPFIDMANELVTECCADAGYTATRLELIERWLSAHFYVIRDPRASSESAGVSISYANPNVGMAIHGTKEGQQALLLDTAGGLTALSKSSESGRGRTVGVTWMGSDTQHDASEEEA